MVRMRFAGREYDAETGLYFMRARYYDPAVGRFISEDPIGIGGGMNLYAYAGSDPVNGRDPFGLDPDCPDGPKCKAQPLPDLDVPGERPPIGPPAMDDPFERREAFEEHEYGHLRPREAPAPTVSDWRFCAANAALAGMVVASDIATFAGAGLALKFGAVALGRSALARTFASNAFNRAWVGAEIATANAYGSAAVRLGAATIGGSAVADVELNTYASSLGSEVSWKDFVPGWASWRAVKGARAACAR